MKSDAVNCPAVNKKDSIIEDLINSAIEKRNSFKPTDYILDWVYNLNNDLTVSINKTEFYLNSDWFYNKETGQIENKNKTFFQISGIEYCSESGGVFGQPILIQDEIGFLGIIVKKINGVAHFLMQAKIEPGNVNKIQISPTIQATKSNFTQKHGGRKPLYLEYFINANQHTILVDQIQSEQSSRFNKKRNRNIIIYLEENVEVELSPNHIWLTLWQIKQLLKQDNLVNMDTRTVLSAIPFHIYDFCDKSGLADKFSDNALYKSMLCRGEGFSVADAYNYINNYKMFNENYSRLIPLSELKSWEFIGNEYVCRDKSPFKVIFCEIEIEGREVRRWSQPLFEAIGMAFFGLIMKNINGVKYFLIQAKPEIGCFDKIEFAPTVQLESGYATGEFNLIEKTFFDFYDNNKSAVKYDVVLSEEGGRFYREQNKNVIVEIGENDLSKLPDGYFWLTYRDLNDIITINNVLNIQLRNLISLLEI